MLTCIVADVVTKISWIESFKKKKKKKTGTDAIDNC